MYLYYSKLLSIFFPVIWGAEPLVFSKPMKLQIYAVFCYLNSIHKSPKSNISGSLLNRILFLYIKFNVLIHNRQTAILHALFQGSNPFPCFSLDHPFKLLESSLTALFEKRIKMEAHWPLECLQPEVTLVFYLQEQIILSQLDPQSCKKCCS